MRTNLRYLALLLCATAASCSASAVTLGSPLPSNTASQRVPASSPIVYALVRGDGVVLHSSTRIRE